jgi:Bacterial TSP3 repeat
MPVPVGLDTGSGNGPSFVPQIAADGRTLVFTSFASDLVPNDYNQSRDVFAYRLGSPDTDQDGLDDDWEVAYFNTLERNGSGDYDQDGLSDAAEFQAGTDPTNVGSVLSMTLLTDLGQNAVIVQWNSVTGRTYDVQYKDSLSNGWSTLSAGVPADGPTKSVVDRTEPRPPERFYRVVLSP